MTESFWIIDAIAREALLFASVGLLLGGVDDLAIDFIYILQRLWQGRRPRLTLATLPSARLPGRIAVFVAAWDESAVIGNMLTTALARFTHSSYRIYVGVYPNDRATIDVVATVAEHDDRIRIVIGSRPGPTTKADCLNAIWHALCSDEARDGIATKAIVLHDAEDVVHAAELTVFDSLIERHDVIQLPVLPLVKPGAQLVSGHYADEFAEAHAKQLVVRTALGAGMPLAGTGCAIAPHILARIAAARGGDPFDATSLTEDYELGLRMAELGASGCFARISDGGNGAIVAVRAYFPGTMNAAVRQKTRWMTGIALAGWDRTGWARPFALADHWMRMRDRRAPLAVLVLAIAYVSLLLWGFVLAVHWSTGLAYAVDADPGGWLLPANFVLLGWRLGMRMLFTGRSYGLREAMWSIPRFVVGNVVSLVAAPRAIGRYVGMLRGAAPVWDKTLHEFPDLSHRMQSSRDDRRSATAVPGLGAGWLGGSPTRASGPKDHAASRACRSLSTTRCRGRAHGATPFRGNPSDVDASVADDRTEPTGRSIAFTS